MTRPDPVARSDNFDATLAKNPLVMNLVKLTRQHDRIIKWLVVSIALDVGLSVALIVLAVITNNTAHKADAAAARATSARTQAYLNCQAANVGRQDSLKLWRFVLSFPPPPNETPAARKVRRTETGKFKMYVNKAFAPRDCHHPSAPPKNLPFPHVSGAGDGDRLASPSARPQQDTEAGASSAARPPRPHPAPAPTTRASPSPRPSSRPSPSQSATPHPIQSCLQHPVKCVPLNGATVAGGTGADPPAGLLAVAATGLIMAVGVAWWRYCVSPRFRAPAGRTLRRSADRQEQT